MLKLNVCDMVQNFNIKVGFVVEFMHSIICYGLTSFPCCHRTFEWLYKEVFYCHGSYSINECYFVNMETLS